MLWTIKIMIAISAIISTVNCACDDRMACIVFQQNAMCDTFWEVPTNSEQPSSLHALGRFAVEDYKNIFGLLSRAEALQQIRMFADYSFVPQDVTHDVQNDFDRGRPQIVHIDSYVNSQQIGYYFVSIRNLSTPVYAPTDDSFAMAYSFLRWTLADSTKSFPIDQHLEMEKLKKYIEYEGLSMLRLASIDPYRNIRRAVHECASIAPPTCRILL